MQGYCTTRNAWGTVLEPNDVIRCDANAQTTNYMPRGVSYFKTTEKMQNKKKVSLHHVRCRATSLSNVSQAHESPWMGHEM
jgi:hypothetical protein